MPRKRVTIDYEAVARYASINPTDAELAVMLGVSEGTIANLRGNGRQGRKDPKFIDACNKGVMTGKVSLRRAQFRSAQGAPAEYEKRMIGTGKDRREELVVTRSEVKPNPTMQIWLGKQLLGQREPLEILADTGSDKFKGLPVRRMVVREVVTNESDESEK